MAKRTDPEIWVPISLAQAERVVQQIVGSNGPGVSLVRVLLALCGHDRVVMADLLNDPAFDHSISQHVVTSLLLLSAFQGNAEPSINDLAAEVGVSKTTAFRYLKTWVAVGVLEQDRTRKYRLAARWRDDHTGSTTPQFVSGTADHSK
jgi:hypothetical protein